MSAGQKNTPLLLGLVSCLALTAGCGQSTPVDPDGSGNQDGGAADGGGSPDSAAQGPLANVFRVSPIEDNNRTTVVPLRHLTDPAGKLTGEWATVYNCMPDNSGKPVTFYYGGMTIKGTICTLKQTAAPGSDGNYLQIKPPAKATVGNDPFTEVMMYHHITTYHDYLSRLMGQALGSQKPHIDGKSLRSIVNLQGRVELVGNRWVGLPNAAFFPKESSTLLSQLGVDLLAGQDAIVFGFNNLKDDPLLALLAALMGGLPAVNFSWDASVIYHEYTHYGIGKALWSPAKDKYGLDPTPRGLNEALADYFPSSYLELAKLGRYALGNSARDLSRDLKCPGHIVGEEHRDGEVASGALWAARKVLGAATADQALWNAIVTFTARTNFNQAATAILAEVKKVAPSKHDAVKKIFEGRGFLGCVRLVDHRDLGGPLVVYGPSYGGTASAPADFLEGAPSHLQYRVALQAGVKELTIEYTPSAGDVYVALKPGSGPILWDYTTGRAKHDARVVLQGQKPSGNGPHKLVISGDCLSDKGLVYQLINKGSAAGRLRLVKVTRSTTKTNTSDNFTGCGT
jgi:hypothetical protein